MKQIHLKPQINSAGKSSQLFIGVDLLEKMPALYDDSTYSKIFVLTDKTVAPILLDTLLHVLPSETAHLVVPAGERAKHIGTVQEIWTAMRKAGCNRNTLVINLGGGVICDIGGFAASTYMRGVDFVNIPTTLLAQVDASVGGKTGIDFDGVKNLIGTFDQPRAVIIDPTVLKTLPEREFVAGFGEIIKHGLISSRAYLEQVTAKPPLEFTAVELEQIITGSCHIKAEVVQQDAAEAGLRQTVNFGHTVGHAVEALSLETDHPLLHGEAVGIGMIVEAELSRRKGLLSAKDAGLVSEYVQAAGLPIAVPPLSLERLLKTMLSDKKNRGDLRFTLLKGLGQTVYDQEISPTVVEEALREHMEHRQDG